MRLLISILMLFVIAVKSPAAFYPNYFTTNANPQVPGGVVSNYTGLTFAFATAYTNATPYYEMIFIDATLVNAANVQGSIRSYVDFDGDGVIEDSQFYGVSSASSITDRVVLREFIPPYGKFTFTNTSTGGSTAAITATTGKAFYFATNGYSGPIASLINPSLSVSTNFSDNRNVIYVSGNASAQVNGTYSNLWYNSTTQQGVWTNSSGGTNIIWQNNPSGGDTTAAFIITPSTNEAVNFMYSSDQVTSYPGQPHSFWINPMAANSAYFSGTANMFWGTNIDSIAVLRTLANTNNMVLPGYQNTNTLRVSLQGDDGVANRTNGFPFKTLWAANNASASGDLILVEPGFHQSYGMHMKRGVQIEGYGRSTVVNILQNDDPQDSTFFQSRLISVWDNCTLGNMVISNGAVGFTQHEGSILGGTNSYAHDLWIYPATNTIYAGSQPSYFNYGVKVSRIGTNIRMERLHIFSGMAGIDFQSLLNGITSVVDIVDCDIICSPEYVNGISNIWASGDFLWPSSTGVGGMINIGFSSGDSGASFNNGRLTVNVIGGRFASLNGGTNKLAYVGGESQASRNAGIWVSRGVTTNIVVNLVNSPQFIHGTTNAAASYFILNEATNNNVSIVGNANVKLVQSSASESGTNYLWQGSSVGSPFSSTVLGGYYWNSNNALYWVTPTQTKLISDGR